MQGLAENCRQEKPGKMPEIKILLADDHITIRKEVKFLIEKQGRVEIVGEADNGRSAVEKALALVPDIIIMDIHMPVLNGIEATKQILARRPEIKVIALSMFSEPRYVMEMLRAGVSGFVLKSCVFTDLLDAVDAVSGGGRYLSRRISDIVMDVYHRE